MLHRYKLSSTDSCPLCGQHDGGHHALSACPSLYGAVTKRHNDAGSLIVQAIHEGDRAAELVMSDVGLSRRCAIMKRKGRIPLAALPIDTRTSSPGQVGLVTNRVGKQNAYSHSSNVNLNMYYRERSTENMSRMADWQCAAVAPSSRAPPVWCCSLHMHRCGVAVSKEQPATRTAVVAVVVCLHKAPCPLLAKES